MAEQRRRLLRNPAEAVVVLVAASILAATVWTATNQVDAPRTGEVAGPVASPSPSLVGAHVSGRSSARGPVTGLHERSPLPTPGPPPAPAPAATVAPQALSEWLTAQVPRSQQTGKAHRPSAGTATAPAPSATASGSPPAPGPAPVLGPPATGPDAAAPSVTAPTPAETSTPPSLAPPTSSGPEPSPPAPTQDMAPPDDDSAPPTGHPTGPGGDRPETPETAVVAPGG